MPRPSQRDQIIGAYITLAMTGGPEAITLESVAAAAGVSKSGLLYHFKSKDAMLDGLIERADQLNVADIAEAKRRAADGHESVAHYYLRTSHDEPDHDPDLFRTTVALMKLAGTEERAATAARSVMSLWLDALTEDVGDRFTADLIAVCGDGIYLREIVGHTSDDLGRDWQAVLRRLAPQ